MEQVPVRRYAHPFDRPVEGNKSSHGVDPSPDAIGGYYGMGWYEYFVDHKTGERFRVHCSDGVNGGKGTHPDSVMPWMQHQMDDILARTIEEARAGASEIRISTPEWNIMLGRVHHGWIDLKPDQKYPDGDRTLDEGQIGTCHGVPVIVDPKMENPLGEPPL